MALPAVQPLDPVNLPRLAAALARAFQDDPLQTHVLPDPAERAARSPAHFAPLIAYGLRFGTVLTTAGEPLGASVWLPPGETEVTEARAHEAGLDKLPELLGEAPAARFFAALEAVDPLHKADMPADHWYLLVLGVDPVAQGRGLARALLAPVLAEADRDGHPCYLETAQPANVGLYRHLGFRVLREVVHEASGLRLWTFRRDPPAGGVTESGSGMYDPGSGRGERG